MKLSVALIAGIAAFASAAPASTHVVHEKREIDTARWVQSDVKLDRRAVIPMSVGLKQRNLENGYDYLMDVSDPKSKNYGKHWDSGKVRLEPLVQILRANANDSRSSRHSDLPLSQSMQSSPGSVTVVSARTGLSCHKATTGSSSTSL